VAALAVPSASALANETHVLAVPFFTYHRTPEEQTLTVINLLIARGFSIETRGEAIDIDVLEVPFASLFEHEIEGDEVELEFLSVLFAKAFAYEREKEGEATETEFQVLDLGLLKLYEQEQDDEECVVDVLRVPPFHLFRLFRYSGDRSGYAQVKLLELTPFRHTLFSLYDYERDGDAEYDRKILSLPLVGPLYRHTKDGDRHRFEILRVLRF